MKLFTWYYEYRFGLPFFAFKKSLRDVMYSIVQKNTSGEWYLEFDYTDHGEEGPYPDEEDLRNCMKFIFAVKRWKPWID